MTDLKQRESSRLFGLRELTRFLGRASTPLELQLLGRTLLHCIVVGAAVGLAGSILYRALEYTEHAVLERLAGYETLRAAGEEFTDPAARGSFQPWLLAFLPAIGALIAGLISARFAPETRGGGTDAIVRAFHEHRGVVRRRVPLTKALASLFTLGFGGSGGREGPTMQIGGALGSIVGRYLRVEERERRILLVAGLAAGISAVFRTPLGAALLAVEILHRDDFESDALVPSVLASVTAYSVFVSFFGEATLFAHAPRYPFVPEHLPLYAAMALVVTLGALGFVGLLHRTKSLFDRAAIPAWAKPAVGGLCLGILVSLLLVFLGESLGAEGRGVGLLGGGYGAAQLAITGVPWLPPGWRGVGLIAALALAKAVATSLTVGSGGSAGDFGPSLVIGGLIGGAFGRAVQLLLDDPRIDPGAFALVGMGTFYGGLAHVPIASLVMICELAGSYDLLVPLMLAEAIAFVALRRHSLYDAQVKTKRDSPAHRDELVLDVLRDLRVAEVLVNRREYMSFAPEVSARDVLEQTEAAAQWQDVFPVMREDGRVLGVITLEVVRTLAMNPAAVDVTVALDLMIPSISILETDDVHTALEKMLASGQRELLVLDEKGLIVGFLDEAEIHAAYHRVTSRAAGLNGADRDERPRPSNHDDP
jgi:CIC family chloride channel protein